MVFGGPLLKKKTKSTKVTIDRLHLEGYLEPILRTLGYIQNNETVTSISWTIPEKLPITIKKEVLKFNAPSEPSKRD